MIKIKNLQSQMMRYTYRQTFSVLALLTTPGSSFVVPAAASKSPHHQRQQHQRNYSFGGSDFAEAAKGSLSSLSVTELKRLLSERGVDFRDCLEKRDLVNRLQNSEASRNGRQATQPITGLTDQEQSLISTSTTHIGWKALVSRRSSGRRSTFQFKCAVRLPTLHFTLYLYPCL